MKAVFVCLILFFNSIHLFSSNLIDIDRTQKNRLKNLVLFEIGTYSLGLYAMNELWYKAVSYTHLTLPTKRIV